MRRSPALSVIAGRTRADQKVHLVIFNVSSSLNNQSDLVAEASCIQMLMTVS